MTPDFITKMVQKIMKIFQINKYQILIFCGFLIVSFIFYARVLLKKLPRELNADLPFNVKIVFSYLFLLVLILFFANIYKYLINNNYYKPKTVMLTNSLRFQITKIFEFWSNSLYAVHFYLIEKFPKILLLFRNLGNFIYKKIPYKQLNILNILFIIIPKIVVLISFMIDVFNYNVLNYFYKTSILLLIPLIFNYLRFAIEESYLKSIREFNEVVIIKNKETQEHILAETYTLHYCKNPEFDFSKYTYSFTTEFKKKYENEHNIDYAATLEDFMIDFNVCVQIVKYMIVGLQIQHSLYGSRYYIVLYLFYILSWFYVLILIF